MKLHVRKGDTVEILSGKDSGKRGKILEVFLKEGKILVDGVQVVKRHTRPRPPKIPHGGILEKTLPIFSSKAMLVCPNCSRPTRISKKTQKGRESVRICKKCRKEIE